MRMTLFICAIILGLGNQVQSQTMVGLSKSEVISAMKRDFKKFHKDDSVIKQRYNYLKYINGPRTKTWIIYFNDEDICKSSKVVCDYSDFDEVFEEINSKYSQTGEYSWEFRHGSDTIQVELKKLEWYFSVRESKKATEVL